jgi:hypothetical protein
VVTNRAESGDLVDFVLDPVGTEHRNGGVR